MQHPLY